MLLESIVAVIVILAPMMLILGAIMRSAWPMLDAHPDKPVGARPEDVLRWPADVLGVR